MIRVTCTALNAGRLARSCIRSVIEQTNQDWTLHYFDAMSDDATPSYIKIALDESSSDVIKRCTLTQESKRTGRLDKLVPLWRSFDPNDIIVWVDGDDQLATSKALQTVADAHAAGALLTYGQFIWSDGRIGFAAPVGPDPRREHWRATHLKTFRAKLFQKIRDEDLRDPDTGGYADFIPDQLVMLPMLEMAPSRAVFIDKVLYVYNDAHSHLSTREKTWPIERAELTRIRAMPRYGPLDEWESNE